MPVHVMVSSGEDRLAPVVCRRRCLAPRNERIRRNSGEFSNPLRRRLNGSDGFGSNPPGDKRLPRLGDGRVWEVRPRPGTLPRAGTAMLSNTHRAQAIFPGPDGMRMTTARTCGRCGTDTASYVDCCGMVLCIDYTDPRCCAERHFGNHTWCELCLAAGGQRSLATQQHYWPGALEGERQEVDLCQECAEQVEHAIELHLAHGGSEMSERSQEPADENSWGGPEHPSN